VGVEGVRRPSPARSRTCQTGPRDPVCYPPFLARNAEGVHDTALTRLGLIFLASHADAESHLVHARRAPRNAQHVRTRGPDCESPVRLGRVLHFSAHPASSRNHDPFAGFRTTSRQLASRSSRNSCAYSNSVFVIFVAPRCSYIFVFASCHLRFDASSSEKFNILVTRAQQIITA